MRLIDADKLLYSIKEHSYTIHTIGGVSDHIDYGMAVNVIQQCIDEAPTVDPAKHAYWSMPKYNRCICSACGYEVYTESELMYCPGCGSRMDAEHESEAQEYKRVKCPRCGGVVRDPADTNFCEWCGKKLR